jgi:2-oxoglutarate ferredoxin oxidoreductase subunit beta
LTKGQFSATADKGSKLKTGDVNELQPIDLCGLAIELGCGFVARSFAGDPKQLISLLKAAASHKGTAVIDVISPCVTFNNHEGSTKSYKYSKEHEIPLHELGYIPFYEQISVDYEEGQAKDVQLHDGSHIVLKKLDRNYDPTDRLAAINLVKEAHDKKEFLTGLIYIDEKMPSFTDLKTMSELPLALQNESTLRPSKESLDKIMKSLM